MSCKIWATLKVVCSTRVFIFTVLGVVKYFSLESFSLSFPLLRIEKTKFGL